ncbi:MAG: hypothetical protein HYU98_00120 [Deltaproteobacteria bacterium]|nr:hypothetical protein [Deltaproteobacteria bacterium]
MISEKMPEVKIMEAVKDKGYHSILDDGLEKIKNGITTVEEVLKVTESL